MGWSNGKAFEAAGRHKLWPVRTQVLLFLGSYVPASCLVESQRASVQAWELPRGKGKPPRRFASLHCPAVIFIIKITRGNRKSIGAQLSTTAIKQTVDNQL